MTFENRKTTGKNWDKSKAKREELHDRDVEKANDPKSVIKQTDDDLNNDSKDEKDNDE